MSISAPVESLLVAGTSRKHFSCAVLTCMLPWRTRYPFKRASVNNDVFNDLHMTVKCVYGMLPFSDPPSGDSDYIMLCYVVEHYMLPALSHVCVFTIRSATYMLSRNTHTLSLQLHGLHVT